MRFRDHYIRGGLFSRYQDLYEFLKNSEMSLSGGSNPQDFTEIARHNLYLFFLIGTIESFLSSLTPLYILPFFYGLNIKNRLNSYMLLILTLISVYFLGGYLFLLARNYITSRYLLVPVILAIPFVGYGFERLANLVERRRRGRSIFMFVFTFILLLPVADSFEDVFDEKKEIKIAGEWLRRENLHNNRILTSDERVPFYAGLFRNDYSVMSSQGIIDRSRTEFFLHWKKHEVIVLRSSSKIKVPGDTSFIGFYMVKSFGDSDNTIRIYMRDELQ